MEQQQIDTPVMRAFVWSGVVVIVGLLFAQGWLMGFIPPPSPHMDAKALTQIFVDRRTDIQIGALIQCVCWSFYALWTIAITMFIRRMERGMPILTYASLALNGGGYVFFLLIPMTWAVIAFRINTLDPSIVQIMNDWVWFDWLFTWPPFSIWMLVIAVAVFRDHNPVRLYPRWVAYFNLWSAVLIFPAGLIVFFKTGPFAYNGIISFWWDVLVFFGWIAVMTVMTFKAITAEDRRQSGKASPQRANATDPRLTPASATGRQT